MQALLAGGSGITPMIQILHACLGNTSEGARVTLLYSNRAESALRRGRFKAAFDDAERAIALAPASDKAHARRAKAARAVGRYEEAATSLSAASS